MKEITKIIYLAEDGEEFVNKEDCLEYEKKLLENKNRLDFLSKKIKEEMYLFNGLITDENQQETLDDIWIEATLSDGVKMGMIWNVDGKIIKPEFDEDICFDTEKLNEFENLIKMKYGYVMSVPYYYFPK